MKKVLLILLNVLTVTLIGCASYSDYSASTIRLSQNIDHIPADTVIVATSEASYRVAKGTQIIEKSGIYKTSDNIYDEDGEKILIPRHAIISGIYSNDGIHCKITWKSIYRDMDSYYNKQGSFSLARRTHPSYCDAERGVKSGDKVTIKFKN